MANGCVTISPMSSLTLNGISIEVTRKKINTLRIVVYPPDGRVSVSAPLEASDEIVRQMVLERMDWIVSARRKMQARGAAAVPAPAVPQLVSGEEVLFRGQRLTLRVVEQPGPAQAVLRPGGILELRLRRGSTVAQRAALLEDFYRDYLAHSVPLLIQKWEKRMGVQASALTIRRMKTRWGSCNFRTHRITLNLELARRSDACLELVLVHELAHLLEHGHTPKFRALMSSYLPNWKTLEKELKKKPISGNA